ncbi:hypothetical protein D3C72_126480 [compost metagenome]
MKSSRFTEEQIIRAIEEVEVDYLTADLDRDHSITDQTFSTGSANTAAWKSVKPSNLRMRTGAPSRPWTITHSRRHSQKNN